MPNIWRNLDPVLAAINTFQNHPSFVNFKQRELNTTFSFNNTIENELAKVIKSLYVYKTFQGYDIQTKIMKLNIDLSISFFANTLTMHKYR